MKMIEMNDVNKITHTKVGDNIHYYVNGNEGRGVVVKMNNAYVSVLKDNGAIDEIHINETFFIKDILTNKTWNSMTLEEKTDELVKAHAFSPRFLNKTWEELPQELKDVLSKSNVEESTHGQVGGNRAGVSTKIPFDADEDYEGESDDDKKEEFKHEKEKPKVEKNNGIEESHKDDEEEEKEKEDGWRKTGGESDKQKNFINKTDRKYGHGYGAGAGTDITPVKPKVEEHGDENTKYFDIDGKPLGTGAKGKKLMRGEKDTSAPSVGKAYEVWLEKRQEFLEKKVSGDRYLRDPRSKPRPKTQKDLDAEWNRHQPKLSGDARIPRNPKNPRVGDDKDLGFSPPKQRVDKKPHDGDDKRGAYVIRSQKQFGKVQYGVKSLVKEGDGAGNSGVNSSDTTGVYNARYSDSKGRYRDQEKDTDKKGEEKDDGRRSRD